MQNLNFLFKAVISITALLLLTASGLAQDEPVDTAEKLMQGQLTAIVKGDYKKFVANGNKAFKEFMDEYTFDSFKMQNGGKLSKGFKLEYLGAIRRLGMREHLWRVRISGDKYALFGSLSLSHGKIVGFNLN